ncbi:unnamed protein product (macronuclear) [Paramecium tetraurelia]|uniref:CTLH domain-containing protein n=1 Tax=Paramecium tetraurelia TaxID=5888 RepID=A0C3N2_PARTE|nr:uncharacterized protein GSPATT00034878001 [Paramecium tetraurelia]CAK65399.1 unnamed protein product [Paramecium tetraurelia]|eukprot:XP_001432796.1 hypothetical protein (macronuclear) [Paramecium tetraurelia strain d4-2]
MDLNEENIVQILGEFLASDGLQYYTQLQEIFSCLSDEDCDHLFFDFILGFLKSEPPYKSLQLVHAFLTAISSPQTYICELIEQQHYEILALHLQINKFNDIQIKQIVYDKLKEQSTDYKLIFLLQRLYFLLDPNKQDSAEQIFANNLKIIPQIFSTIQEDTLVQYLKVQSLLVPFCKEVQQQKLMKLLMLIKQQNNGVGIQLQWAIYEVYEQMGCDIDPPELEEVENNQAKISFRLYYVKQKFMQNVKQISTLIRSVEDEQKDNFKLYTQWQLQI